MANETVILNKEDINNPLHPGLWYSILETMGIDSEATEVCIELSSLDHNKKLPDPNRQIFIDELVKLCNVSIQYADAAWCCLEDHKKKNPINAAKYIAERFGTMT